MLGFGVFLLALCNAYQIPLSRAGFCQVVLFWRATWVCNVYISPTNVVLKHTLPEKPQNCEWIFWKYCLQYAFSPLDITKSYRIGLALGAYLIYNWLSSCIESLHFKEHWRSTEVYWDKVVIIHSSSFCEHRQKLAHGIANKSTPFVVLILFCGGLWNTF